MFGPDTATLTVTGRRIVHVVMSVGGENDVREMRIATKTLVGEQKGKRSFLNGPT
jgi:hypothetical protein